MMVMIAHCSVHLVFLLIVSNNGRTPHMGNRPIIGLGICDFMQK